MAKITEALQTSATARVYYQSLVRFFFWVILIYTAMALQKVFCFLVVPHLNLHNEAAYMIYSLWFQPTVMLRSWSTEHVYFHCVHNAVHSFLHSVFRKQTVHEHQLLDNFDRLNIIFFITLKIVKLEMAVTNVVS